VQPFTVVLHLPLVRSIHLMTRKISLLATIMLLFSLAALCQDKEGYWGIAVGIRPQSVQDDLITKMRYSGAPVYFMINHIREKPDKLSFFQFEGSVGSIRTKSFSPEDSPSRFIQPRVTSYWNEITYANLFLFKADEQSKWWIGPSVSSLIWVRYSARWDNSAINYDFSGNLQGEVRYQREFKLFGKAMTGVFALKIPVIGFVTRPIYAGVPDFLDQESGFESQLFENTSVSWIGNFPHIQFDNYIEFPIAGGNRIQILYNWEYYSFQEPSQVQAAAHVIGINFLMRTK